ncbi:MAG: Ig-like domain-containing protein [Candidatus Thermoplasmatota archaeon]|nr:Ig-like domain-containing protein [Candidatus Thermoplasmatota archaeon]
MKQALAIAVLTALVVPSALAFTLDSPAPAPLTGPANGDSGSYAGVLRLYVVEPVSRWNDYEGDPYHFGFLDYAFNEQLSIPFGDTWEESITWDAAAAGYGDVDQDNLMVMAAVFNPQIRTGYANPPFSNPFDAHYVDAAAAVRPGETESSFENETYTHTVFAEKITATWCRYCPAMSRALYGVYQSHDFPFYFVAMVADKNDLAAQRVEDYNLAGYPSCFFDGGRRVIVGGYEDQTRYRNAIGSALTADVHELELTLSSQWDNGQLVIDVSITNQEEGDFTPPQVSIDRPTEGTIYLMDRELLTTPFDSAIVIGAVTVNATATDESGIQRVEFMVCGELLATVEDGPYSFMYEGTFGGHTLEVIAYDTWGNWEQSSLRMYVINY